MAPVPVTMPRWPLGWRNDIEISAARSLPSGGASSTSSSDSPSSNAEKFVPYFANTALTLFTADLNDSKRSSLDAALTTRLAARRALTRAVSELSRSGSGAVAVAGCATWSSRRSSWLKISCFSARVSARFHASSSLAARSLIGGPNTLKLWNTLSTSASISAPPLTLRWRLFRRSRGKSCSSIS